MLRWQGPIYLPFKGTSFKFWNIFLYSETSEAAAPAIQCSAMASMSEMAVHPSPVASNNHFPLTPLEMSMGMDAPALGSTFTSDANVGELEAGLDVDVASSRDSTRSLSHIWNFSLSDLTTDCENLGNQWSDVTKSKSEILVRWCQIS